MTTTNHIIHCVLHVISLVRGIFLKLVLRGLEKLLLKPDITVLTVVDH